MNDKDQTTLAALAQGKITVEGEFLWGSNYTFSAKVQYHDQEFPVVYKPIRGERPLWDFPAATLARREVAAYLVSEALGWRLVPPTVFRQKAPFGPGSLQLFIEHDPEYHYFNFTPEDQQRLRPTALFDVLINNADRKGSHILLDADRHIWLIDHGVCFHIEEKLRTVVWDFAGETLPEDLCAGIAQFRHRMAHPDEEQPAPQGQGVDRLAGKLARFISPNEVAALAERADRLLRGNRFPSPSPYRRPYPWPQI